jgi:hypothetical protein
MSRSNPTKRKPRTTRHTTLIVVEGESEAVLIKHIKNHFGHDAGSRIMVKSASGNGDAVLKMAINSFEAFDRRVALYDADWQPQKKHLQAARKRKIQILTCSPCLEGLLLEVLGEKPASTSAECKRRLKLQLAESSLTNQQTYERHFTPSLLTSRADSLTTLLALLDLFKAPL